MMQLTKKQALGACFMFWRNAGYPISLTAVRLTYQAYKSAK